MVVISFKIEPKLKKLLERLAKEESRSLSGFVKNCIHYYLKREKAIDWHKSPPKK